MTPLQKGLLETATGRQRRGEPPLSLQPATRSPAVVPCAHSWRCPVAHCEPADRHDREHAAKGKIGTPWLFAYSNSTDRRKRIFTNRFSRSHRISLNRFTFQLLVRNVSSPSKRRALTERSVPCPALRADRPPFGLSLGRGERRPRPLLALTCSSVVRPCECRD